MRFLLLIHWDEKAAADAGFPDDEAEMKAHGEYIQAMQAAGVMRDGMRLGAEATGRRVQVRAGKRTVTDGPFADCREALGGLYVLECASMEEAVGWAARCPSAARGTIEVRPEWTP